MKEFAPALLAALMACSTPEDKAQGIMSAQHEAASKCLGILDNPGQSGQGSCTILDTDGYVSGFRLGGEGEEAKTYFSYSFQVMETIDLLNGPGTLSQLAFNKDGCTLTRKEVQSPNGRGLNVCSQESVSTRYCIEALGNSARINTKLTPYIDEDLSNVSRFALPPQKSCP